jgi:hypothetical protein
MHIWEASWKLDECTAKENFSYDESVKSMAISECPFWIR